MAPRRSRGGEAAREADLEAQDEALAEGREDPEGSKHEPVI